MSTVNIFKSNYVYVNLNTILSIGYAPQAYRGYVRELLKNMERIRPSAIVDIIHSAEMMKLDTEVKIPPRMNCSQCGFISSNKIWKACVLLDGLNKGKAKIAIGRKALISYEDDSNITDDLPETKQKDEIKQKEIAEEEFKQDTVKGQF